MLAQSPLLGALSLFLPYRTDARHNFGVRVMFRNDGCLKENILKRGDALYHSLIDDSCWLKLHTPPKGVYYDFHTFPVRNADLVR